MSLSTKEIFFFSSFATKNFPSNPTKDRMTSMIRLVFFGFFFISTFVFASNEPSRSIGIYWKGKLKNGINAHEIFRSHFPLIASVSPSGHQFANRKLVDALLDVSQWLQEQWSGKYSLIVGDISRKFGGRLARHETHQNGLDADISYLSSDPQSEGHRSRLYHNRFPETFVLKGKVLPSFDVVKNYELFRYIVMTQDVSQIFLSCKIKRALMTYEPPGELPEEREALFTKLVTYPYHDDHFHLRLTCPEDDRKCRNDRREWIDFRCPLVAPNLQNSP
jgi:penicillin-insensitive murein DD-endopeptidase